MLVYQRVNEFIKPSAGMIYDRGNGNEQSTERSNNLITIGYCAATENKLLKWGLSWDISLESDP